MIASTHRFHGHASLNYLHSKGVVVRTNGISMKYVANQRRSAYRVAVIVSKKVHKSAVVRNRIRRRIYELVRKYPIELGRFDFAFMVYDEAVATMPHLLLSANIEKMLQKVLVTSSQTNQRVTLEEKR